MKADARSLVSTDVSLISKCTIGAHHTVELGIRSRLTLAKKSWDAAQRDAVARAADAAATADLACLLLDVSGGRAGTPFDGREPGRLFRPP